MKIYPIVPCPAPRMSQSDRWKKRPCVLRYRAFRDEILLHRVTIPDRVRIIFHMPMPASWSAKKRAEMDGKPHQVRPDIDNLAKACSDAVFSEDSHIYELHARKVWSVEGGIEIGEIE